MDRFGSSKLRIVWALVFLFLSGLVFMAVKGVQGPEGSQVYVAGLGVLPLGADTLRAKTLGILDPVFYGTVSMIVLCGGIFPLGTGVSAAAPLDRVKGFLGNCGLGVLHGAFLAQVATLPLWALSFRMCGEPFPPELLKADLLGLLLGIQLLLWVGVLMRLFRSNLGLAVLFTLLLREVGPTMAWFSDFGEEAGLTKGAVATVKVLQSLLPMSKLPSDPFSPMALPLSIGGPLLLGCLVLLIPSRSGKAPAPKKAKK